MFTSYIQNLRICFIAEVNFLGVLRTTQWEHYSGSSGRIPHSKKCPIRENRRQKHDGDVGIKTQAESGDG